MGYLHFLRSERGRAAVPPRVLYQNGVNSCALQDPGGASYSQRLPSRRCKLPGPISSRNHFGGIMSRPETPDGASHDPISLDRGTRRGLERGGLGHGEGSPTQGGTQASELTGRGVSSFQSTLSQRRGAEPRPGQW